MEDFENIFSNCHRQLHCFWCFELSVEIFKKEGQRTGRPWHTKTMGCLRRKHKMKMSWVVEEVALLFKVGLFKVLPLLIVCNTWIDFLLRNLVVAFCQCCTQYKRNCSTLQENDTISGKLASKLLIRCPMQIYFRWQEGEIELDREVGIDVSIYYL